MHKKLLETDVHQCSDVGKRPYDLIATIYDSIMDQVDYDNWAEYIYHVIRFTDIPVKNILELAAGNGHLSHYLLHYFDDIVITDVSLPMIKEKKKGSGLRVCCDMIRLPFKAPFSVIFSTFDSVNYLLEEREVVEHFTEVSNIMQADGIFTFDVSLERNSILHSSQHRTEIHLEGVRYHQKSIYDVETQIHKNEFTLMYEDGRVIREEHKQRIYPFTFYFEALDKANLFVTECFDGFSFEDGNDASERVQFIAMRKS